MSSIIVRLKKVQKLGTNEKEISEYIIENIAKLTNIDIRVLARKINLSPSSVTRFVKKLGYDSFSEFKFEIKNYLRTLNEELVTSNLSNLIGEYVSELNNKISLNKVNWVKGDTFLKVTEKIEQASKIFVFAQGGTYSCAYDFTLRLQRIGYTVLVSNDHIIQETLFNANCNTSSLFIIFSFSGETKNLVKISNKINEKKLVLISFTNDLENTIKLKSTLNIPIYLGENNIKTLMSGNRIMFLLAIDILLEQLMTRKKEISVKSIINTSE